MQEPSAHVVLVVDNDEREVEYLCELIGGLGYEVQRAFNWQQALKLLREHSYRAVFLDLHLGTSPQDGFILLDRLEKEGLTVPTQIVSHSADLIGVEAACLSYSFVRTRPIPKSNVNIYRGAISEFLRQAVGFRTFAAPQGQHNVFVVHGRNHDQRDRLVSIIQNLGLHPVVLGLVSRSGQTLIELFEQHASTAAYAVIVMTADDIGFLAGEESNKRRRPRQNVVLETGFFYGKIGREKVMILTEPQMELPSNIHGIVYESLAATDDALRLAIMRELSNLGIRFEV